MLKLKGWNKSLKKNASDFSWLFLFVLQILMSVASMRHCVALMASVRTDWVPSDASVTRATRSLRMAKAVRVSPGVLVHNILSWRYCIIVYLHMKCIQLDLHIIICLLSSSSLLYQFAKTDRKLYGKLC